MKKFIPIVFGLMLSAAFLMPGIASAQNGQNDPILQAFMEGDYDKLEALVKQGGDINAVSREGTLLHMVSHPLLNMMIGIKPSGEKISEEQRQKIMKLMEVPRNTNERMVPLIKWLIAHGAKVDVQDKEGNTPLHMAAGNGYLKHVEVLLANGANINIPNKSGRTPFYLAMKNSRGDSSIAKRMFAKNPDLTIGMDGVKQGFYQPYIYLAVDSGDPEVVKYFIDRGANLNEENGQFQTAYQEAIRMQDPQILDYLKSLNINQPGSSAPQTTALFKYAESDYNLPEAKTLLTQGANINIKNKEGLTPLHVAIHEQQRGMTKFLLENGANPNSTDNDGRTLFGDAVMHGDQKIVEMLVDKGADVNLRGSFGTPLSLASREDMRNYLISKGAIR